MSEFTLYIATLRDLLRFKKLLTAALVICVPLALSLLLRFSRPADLFNPTEVYDGVMQSLIFSFAAVVLALVFSTNIITQEVEQKTIVYLLTRPIARWRILTAKFLAAMTMTIATTWVASLALIAACFLGAAGGGKHALRIEQITNPQEFMTKLKTTPNAAILALYEAMPARERRGVEGYDVIQSPTDWALARTLRGINQAMATNDLYNPPNFDDVTLSTTTKGLLQSGSRIEKNRALLQDLFAGSIASPSEAHSISLARDMGILVVAAFAYGSIFLLLATLFKRPLMFGLMFSFGWESWVPNMPGSFQKLSLMSYLKILAPHGETAKPASTTNTMISMANSMIEKDVLTALQSWITLGSVTAIALGLALYLFSVREYVPREDTE